MAKKKPIVSYAHTDKERVNNPPVGLVTAEGDPDLPQKAYLHQAPPPQGGLITTLISTRS